MIPLNDALTRVFRCALFSAIAIALCGALQPAKSAQVQVAIYGVDTPTCGNARQPCRSINRAIANAKAGDTILVGPGNYGDLNLDHDELDPGEEGTQPTDPCVICVRKRLNFFSTAGAASTVITDTQRQLVNVFADGVRFGSVGSGFTLIGGRGSAFTVSKAGNVHVEGNVVQQADTAFYFDAKRGPIYASGNTARQNFVAGFVINSGTPGAPGYVDLRNNVALDNGEWGIVIDGWKPHTVVDNVSVRNGNYGITIRNNTWIARNLIAANLVGVYVEETGNALSAGLPGGGIRLQSNTIINNSGAGIAFSLTAGAPNHQVHLNSVYGNGTAATEVAGISADPLPLNCGILNDSSQPLNANNNYWGAATGPGKNPADHGGPNSGCDLAGMTTVKPFLTGPSDDAP